MQFQIRFPNGDKVPIETLNAEAANLWGIGIARDQVEYVFPTGNGTDIQYDEETSWLEVIGLAIEYPQIVPVEEGAILRYGNWATVRESIFNTQVADIWNVKGEEIVKDISRTLLFLKPYFELIDLWESKSYIPVRTK